MLHNDWKHADLRELVPDGLDGGVGEVEGVGGGEGCEHPHHHRTHPVHADIENIFPEIRNIVEKKLCIKEVIYSVFQNHCFK